MIHKRSTTSERAVEIVLLEGLNRFHEGCVAVMFMRKQGVRALPRLAKPNPLYVANLAQLGCVPNKPQCCNSLSVHFKRNGDIYQDR